MSEIRPIVMPKWGLAMKEGMVAAWHVAEGQAIAQGQEIADIETSKIANVFESPTGGLLRRRVVAEGETVPVGALLAVLAPESVPDAEIDAYVAEFLEQVATEAAEDAEPEPEVVDARAWRIRYLAMGVGDATPVVLIHGFGGDLNGWMFNQPALAESGPTYALDLPGHGGSSKDVGAGDAATLASAVLAFLDAKGLRRAHLVGHSLGGAIALLLALELPERVASVTAAAPAGLGPEIDMEFIEGFIEAKRGKHLRPVLERLVADPSLISRDMIEDVLRFKRLDGVDAALRTAAAAVFPGGRQALDLARRLAGLQPPARILWGMRDRIVPVAHADRVPSTIPVHRLACGHLVHMEKASDVNRLLEQYRRS